MSRINNEEFWKDFFQLYRNYPELWKIKSEGYKNRNKKNAAYELLLTKLKELDPNANMENLKYKINSFRSCYRRELKKKKKSEKSGAGTDDIYTPSLWYFEDLSFLEDQETQVSGISSIDLEEFEGNIEEENVPPAKKKTKLDFGQKERNELLLKAVKALDDSKRPVDDASAFSSTWEVLFRKLEPSQQLFANKTIQEVLYQGALGLLNANTHKLLENVSSHTNSDNASSSSFEQNASQFRSRCFIPAPLQSPAEVISIEPSGSHFYTPRKVFSVQQPQQQTQQQQHQLISNFKPFVISSSRNENSVSFGSNEQLKPPKSISIASYENESEYNNFADLFNDSEYS